MEWYGPQGRSVRAHVRLRWLTCPVTRLAELVPAGSRVLDWGCGHGLVALAVAADDPTALVAGRDVDPVKVASANAATAAAGVGDRVAFEVVPVAGRPEGEWDVIVMSDVLYLQAPADQEALVRSGAGALAPGGLLVCKELGTKPAWKRAVCRAQEQLAVRVLRITAAGSGIADFPTPERVSAWMADEGLVVEALQMDRGYHAPHVAVVGRRAERADS